jgi:Methyltransferase domain
MFKDLKSRLLASVLDSKIAWRINEIGAKGYFVRLEYPVNPSPRYGYGKPVLQGLAEMFENSRESMHDLAAQFVKHETFFNSVPLSAQSDQPGMPFWRNGFFSGFDPLAQCTLIGAAQPSCIYEIGSGNSTKFARAFIKNAGLPTKIVSIDPFPRAEIDELCDQTFRQPAESVSIELFKDLRPNDIVFIDNSHSAYQNSDVTVFMLEILPHLPSGVLVHVHDIFLPFDYPQSWASRHYNEQYLLAAYLIGGRHRPQVDIVWSSPWAYDQLSIREQALKSVKSEATIKAFGQEAVHAGGFFGTSLWMRVR